MNLHKEINTAFLQKINVAGLAAGPHHSRIFLTIDPRFFSMFLFTGIYFPITTRSKLNRSQKEL